MKVYVNQIPDEGKFFEGELPAEILELQPQDRAHSIAPIHYALQVGISDDGLWATGKVSTVVECQCVRCLEKFNRTLSADFAFQTPLEGRETVDLTDDLREDILLALPAHPHCDWDGKKVCKADFTAVESAADSLGERPDAWKALDNLKL